MAPNRSTSVTDLLLYRQLSIERSNATEALPVKGHEGNEAKFQHFNPKPYVLLCLYRSL